MIRSTPPHVRERSGRTLAGWLAAAAAALGVAVGAGEVLDPPTTVDLVVSNASGRAVTVVVSSAGRPDLPIATLEPGEERPVEQVVDQGEQWEVSYRVAGEVVAEESIADEELAERDFRLTVPAGIDE